MNPLFLAAAAALFGQTCEKSCTAQPAAAARAANHATAVVALVSSARPNLVETAIGDARFKTLVAALLASDLAEPLRNGQAKFTVFAPTDEAFAKLDPALLAKLVQPENKAMLADLLKYHVLPGEFSSAALGNSQYRTLAGSKVAVEKDFSVRVGNAHVTTTDIRSSNGVIHAIDTVLMPPSDHSAPRGKDVVAVARQAGSFKILLKALEAARLDGALQNGDARFTVFAPTDAAFRKLGDAKIEALLAHPETLASVLKFHVVAGAAVGAKDFIKAGTAKTLQGGELVADLKDGRLTVNGVKVSTTDVKASNGVIHVIDSVLVP